MSLLASSTKTACRSIRQQDKFLFRRAMADRRFSCAVPSPHNNRKRIFIHFGTSAGTSQLFAQELQKNLQKRASDGVQDITVSSLGETPRVDELDPEALHLFLVSTAGVGEPPGPAVPFFESLDSADKSALSKLHFGVFGLGNSAAHPHHYNVAGKTLHASLQHHRAKAWLPLGLGDDGDCIEEDFDRWQESVIQKLKDDTEATVGDAEAFVEVEQATPETSLPPDATTATLSTQPSVTESTPGAFGKRLRLVPIEVTEEEISRSDLLDVLPEWYNPDTRRWRVHRQISLSAKPIASALHELELELDWKGHSPPLVDKAVSYDAGDHLVVYPTQPDYLVEAYLNHWNIDANAALHSKVELASTNEDGETTYPHPTGISLYDTLRFCVDLQAPPGPRLARVLTGLDDIEYKEGVYKPRQSPLALLMQSNNTSLSFEDLLYQLQPIVPRYYSIASSPLLHRNSVFLTYRPVRYMTCRGTQRSGLCTSFLSELQAGSTVLAYVNKNPGFRLPADPSAPVILLAGGCGIAAIRSLVEELLARRAMDDAHKTPVYIFVGFRNTADAAYIDLMQSLQPDMLEVAYSVSSAKSNDLQLVSDRVRDCGAIVYDLLASQGATLYACGGARTFGAAIQRELHDLYQIHGHCSPAQSQAKLQGLVREGRYCEDLAD